MFPSILIFRVYVKVKVDSSTSHECKKSSNKSEKIHVGHICMFGVGCIQIFKFSSYRNAEKITVYSLHGIAILSVNFFWGDKGPPRNQLFPFPFFLFWP